MTPLTVQGPLPPTAANATWPNVLHTRVADVIAQMKAPPWSKRIIADERQLVTLIASPPGGGNRPHWHSDFDEWWVVLAGVLEWELTGGEIVRANKDDIVWVPRGTVHHIRNVGAELSPGRGGAGPRARPSSDPGGGGGCPAGGRRGGAAWAGGEGRAALRRGDGGAQAAGRLAGGPPRAGGQRGRQRPGAVGQ